MVARTTLQASLNVTEQSSYYRLSRDFIAILQIYGVRFKYYGALNIYHVYTAHTQRLERRTSWSYNDGDYDELLPGTPPFASSHAPLIAP